MTSIDAADRPAVAVSTPLFAVTVFASAALVFMVQPMVTKLVLPLLGGGPSIWNTAVAFFETALLAGYGYAHALQKVRSVKRQAVIHGVVLLLAALALPLRISEMLGEPWPGRPALWLVSVLTVSLAAPFAVLSATAPLVQAWYARVAPPGGRGPYSLYAASNLGSLIALLAYPVVIEPLATLRGQTLGWSVGYGAFMLLIAGLALVMSRLPEVTASSPAASAAPAAPIAMRHRLTWVGLAAVPSSLMLGVTTHLTTDVASAPFLWVVPLALYLTTFIIAFQEKPAISRNLTFILQAAALTACAAMLPFRTTNFALQLPIHLASFFLTALMCHQALVASRPPPARLTEFYLWLSVGGVVGGAFNAFLAPVLFTDVWEYPLVLALACLVRPQFHFRRSDWAWFIAGGIAAALAPIAATAPLPWGVEPEWPVKILLLVAVVAAFLVRDRRAMFFALIVIILISATAVASRTDVRASWRSFFGVLHQSQMPVAALGGTVKMLAHGTTLHGAQAVDPRWRCRPLVYYAPETPIGQVFRQVRSEKPAISVGAVGLGTGAVAAYSRPLDQITFFEIDPLVIRVSSDPKIFSYTTECARGRVAYVAGDAHLTLKRQPKGGFDILLIDAFSSDSVPAHLLTVEAVRSYLDLLKPDGVLILHLSNRHLDLRGPAMAVAHAAGGQSLLQRHRPPEKSPPMWDSAEDVLIVGRSTAALAPYARSGLWTPSDPTLAKPWTDDYTNLVGALVARFKEELADDK
jgi:SAM-dependent methyltransferase